MKKSRIITLLTDFGQKDPFVGVMKGVIYGINPSAVIVDLTHEISPQDIFEGAFDLMQAYSYFPHGTVHIAVVDPGVGSKRESIVVDTGTYLFVAPDNGLVSLAVKNECSEPVVCRIKNDKYTLKEMSTTFHGRDIFAPVGAYLSRGVKPEKIGDKTEEYVTVEIPGLEIHGNTASGSVIHIDKYGNLITNIKKGLIDRVRKIEIKGREITKIRSYYKQGAGDEIIALTGSTGFIELSVNEKSAAAVLGAAKGEEIRVYLK